jgi:hypothetical protein
MKYFIYSYFLVLFFKGIHENLLYIYIYILRNGVQNNQNSNLKNTSKAYKISFWFQIHA